MRRVALLCVLGCSVATGAEQPAAAMALAARGEPGAIAACGALADGGLRGDCLVAYLQAAPTAPEPGFCARIEDPTWVAECHFVRAERRMRAGDTAGAVRACGDAGVFVDDCAGHLYRAAYEADPTRSDPAFAQLAAAFPTVAAPLGADYEVEDEKLQVERLRSRDPISLAGCAGQPNANACIHAAAAVLEARWERRARRDADIHARLCDGASVHTLPTLDPAATGTRALDWTRGPELDAAVRAAQQTVCL